MLFFRISDHSYTVFGGKKFSLKLQFKKGKVNFLFFHSKPYRYSCVRCRPGSEKPALVLKNTRAKILSFHARHSFTFELSVDQVKPGITYKDV